MLNVRKDSKLRKRYGKAQAPVIDISGPEHAELREMLSSPPAPVSPKEWQEHLAWLRKH
jgi:hypothetical protein